MDQFQSETLCTTVYNLTGRSSMPRTSMERAIVLYSYLRRFCRSPDFISGLHSLTKKCVTWRLNGTKESILIKMALQSRKKTPKVPLAFFISIRDSCNEKPRRSLICAVVVFMPNVPEESSRSSVSMLGPAFSSEAVSFCLGTYFPCRQRSSHLRFHATYLDLAGYGFFHYIVDTRKASN